MSERPTDQPSSDVSWGEGGTPNQHTEPSTRRANGHYEGTGAGDADLIVTGYENWLNREHGRHLAHLEAIAVREFSTLSEAIGAVAAPGRFVVHAPAAACVQPWLQHWSTLTGTTITVDGIACDGEILFYTYNGNLYAADPETGTTIATWPGTPPANAYRVAADGYYVYFVRSGAYKEAEVYNRTAGTSVTKLAYHATNTKTWNAIRSNGYYAAAVYMDDAEDIHFSCWSGLPSTPSKVGDYSHGTTGNHLYGLALDHEYAFVGGVRGASSVDVRALKLVDATQLWAATLGDSAMTVHGIATDGELVYVACDGTAVGGSTTNVFALDRRRGGLVWQANLAAFTNASHIACDDRYIYVSGDAGSGTLWTVVMHKHTAAVLEEISGLWAVAADGVAIYGAGYADGLYRRMRGGPSREFMRSAGSDRYRRPFHHLAIPIQGG